MFEHLWGDIRYSVRSLRAQPGFLATVVLTLALGLGVNVAVFTIFHHILLRPLPVVEPQRLVNVETPGLKFGRATMDFSGGRESVMNYPQFRDLEQSQEGVITLAAHRATRINLAHQGQTAELQGVLVSGSYFSVLGLVPAAGRLLSPSDDAVAGQAEAVVLGHELWRDRFGGDPAVVGETVRINGLAMTVVGVAPQGFHGVTSGVRPQLFVPVSVRWPGSAHTLPEHENRTLHWLYVFGRLAGGIEADRAQAVLQARYSTILEQIEAPLQELDEVQRQRFLQRSIVLAPGSRGQSWVQGEMGVPLLALMVIVALVLLIACLNIANLQMARGAGRITDLAVRSAVGASTGRLCRQLLVEALLLALCGALVALPLAAWLISQLSGLLSTEMVSLAPEGLSLFAIAYTLLVAIATVVLFGLFPAWRLSRVAAAQALRAQAGQPGGGRNSHRLRSGLVVVQISLSLALLVLAGLFTRSLGNVSRIDLGMSVDSLLSFTIAPELNGYGPERSGPLFERVETELAALPGVESVAVSSLRLVANNNRGVGLTLQGHVPASEERMESALNEIGTDYFRTLGVPLLAGREFSRLDGPGMPKVAIANRAFVEQFGITGDVVGRRLALRPDATELDIEIVGVVANSVYSNVKLDVPPVLYLPSRQNPLLGRATIYLRTQIPPAALSQSVRAVIARLDPNLPVIDLRSMSAQVQENVVLDRLVGVLSGSFAVLATLLAAVGLYGLLSFIVAQRTRELGLRLALGAPPAHVRALVLRQILKLALIGAVIGLLLAAGLGSAAQSLLFGLSGYDPLVLVSATLLLLAVVLLAAWNPAWRASRTDPLVALRHE